MRGQNKTGTTMLDNIKEYVKNAGSFLFGSDNDIKDGYTDYEDIPDPTIENFPDERKFIVEAAQIEGGIRQKKIVKTSRDSIKENETINKQAKEKRSQMKMSTNPEERRRHINKNEASEYGERA